MHIIKQFGNQSILFVAATSYILYIQVHYSDCYTWYDLSVLNTGVVFTSYPVFKQGIALHTYLNKASTFSSGSYNDRGKSKHDSYIPWRAKNVFITTNNLHLCQLGIRIDFRDLRPHRTPAQFLPLFDNGSQVGADQIALDNMMLTEVAM